MQVEVGCVVKRVVEHVVRLVERVVAMVFGRPDSDVPRRYSSLLFFAIREETFSTTHSVPAGLCLPSFQRHLQRRICGQKNSFSFVSPCSWSLVTRFPRR